MNEDRLYNYLLHAKGRHDDLVITFDDEDRYALEDIDLWYSVDQNGEPEYEPLCVSFDDCINRSNKRLQALREGKLKTPGVGWTSTEPFEPVDMDYTVENVMQIWDNDRQFMVYDRAIDE